MSVWLPPSNEMLNRAGVLMYMTKPTSKPSIDSGIDLAGILYWELPELEADELSGLAATVRSEMELRIGERLSAQCSDEQLDEFSELVDTQDDESCQRWLDKHIPDHSSITRAEVERLIAETVAAVESTSEAKGALRGTKQMRRVERPSHAALLRSLEGQPRQFIENGDAALLDVEPAQGPSFRARLWLAEDGLFCARATYPQHLAQRSRPELLAFSHQWNLKTYFPKAYVQDDRDHGCSDLVAELAIPVRPGLHGALLDHFVTVAVSVTSQMFSRVHDASAEWQPSLL